MSEDEIERAKRVRKDRVEFILTNGITRYVAEVNGISDKDAAKLIEMNLVNVTYLKSLMGDKNQL